MDEKGEKDEIDEIVTYYETVPSDDENDDSASDNADNADNADNSKTLLFRAPKAIKTIPKAVNTAVYESDNGKYVMLIIAAVLVVIIGFITGAFILPSNADAVNKKAERMRQSDSSYLTAKSENATLDASVKALEESSEDIEKTFDSVIEYQKQYDNLSKEYSDLKASYDSICSDYNTLKAGYDKMASELDEIKKKTVTLTPGVHTVGKQIAAGTYNVTGDGSMLAADSNESLKINTVLDDEPFECELTDGDVIKLETEAKFAPKEG